MPREIGLKTWGSESREFETLEELNMDRRRIGSQNPHPAAKNAARGTRFDGEDTDLMVPLLCGIYHIVG